MRHGNTRSLSGIEGLHSGPPTAHVGERANEEPLGRVSGPQTRKGGDNSEIRERGCAVTNPSSTGEVCIEDLAELADHVFVALDCSTVWGLRPVAPFMAYSLICFDLSTSGMVFFYLFSPWIRKSLSQGTSGC